MEAAATLPRVRGALKRGAHVKTQTEPTRRQKQDREVGALTQRTAAASSLPYGSAGPSRPPLPVWSRRLSPLTSSPDLRGKSSRPGASSCRLASAGGAGRLPLLRRWASRRRWPRASGRLLLLRRLLRRRPPMLPPPSRGRRHRSLLDQRRTGEAAPRRQMRAGEESSGSKVKRNKEQKPDSAEKEKEKRRATYHRRGVGARVWLHAKLPVPREAAVRDVVH